jgi:hypothetical protein
MSLWTRTCSSALCLQTSSISIHLSFKAKYFKQGHCRFFLTLFKWPFSLVPTQIMQYVWNWLENGYLLAGTCSHILYPLLTTFLFSMSPHVPYGLRGLPFRLWPKYNRLLRLGHPWGAVTLSQWGGWWYMNMKYHEGVLNLSYTKLPRPWSLWESSPSRKNPHGRTGNRTRDLMISSKKLWPLDHEAGH